MNLSRNDLYRIIIEEYLKEEGLTEATGDVLDLLRRIKNDPDYDPREDPGSHTYDRDEEEEEEGGGSTRTMSRPHRKEPEDKDKGETYTMDIQAAPAPASESPVETIVTLLQGVEHNDAVDILTLAAEALGLAPPEDAGPSTAYGGEELDLRQKQGQRIGFEEGLDLEGLMGLIREVLGEERDLESEKEKLQNMSDFDLIQAAEDEGHDAYIVYAEPGVLDDDSRKKIIAVLANDV